MRDSHWEEVSQSPLLDVSKTQVEECLRLGLKYGFKNDYSVVKRIFHGRGKTRRSGIMKGRFAT